jgi:hypothetical protein
LICNAIIASPHKVGSTWLYQMVAALGFKNARKRDIPDDLRPNPKLDLLALDKSGLNEFLSDNVVCRSFKSHSFPPAAALPPNTALISILRDPRDLLVSWVFHLAALPVDKGGVPELQGLSSTDRLIEVLGSQRSMGECRLYTAWAQQRGALTLRYEALKLDGVGELGRVARHLGLAPTDAELAHVIGEFSFDKIKQEADQARSGLLRKGHVGDWRNHFDERATLSFKKACWGRWNEVLVETGYESGPDWH